MMDSYPQAKLLSFFSGEVSAKNSKNRRNHTGEKSPLRGDNKFNFSLGKLLKPILLDIA